MSNYHREWFPGYEERIYVGAEDVNGEGTVQISIEDHAWDSATVVMPHKEAAEFAAFILAKCAEAAEAQRRERERYDQSAVGAADSDVGRAT